MGMSKREATRKGKELLARMEGEGWKLNVWKNIGWHYCVRAAGVISVYPSSTSLFGDDRFHCLMGGLNHGDILWNDSFHSTDPNEVVRHQLEVAQESVAALIEEKQGIIDKVKGVLGEES